MTTTAIKERPIIMQPRNVLAILAGRKTQTRRAVNLRRTGVDFIGAGGDKGEDWNDPTCWGVADEYGDFWTLAPERAKDKQVIACPYGHVGDRLWVREVWANTIPAMSMRSGAVSRRWLRFRANGESDDVARWSSPLFMPRWASRLTLELTGVRVERLNDISEADAVAEGADDRYVRRGDDGETIRVSKHGGYTPREQFEMRWDSINGKGAWALNPWVWALTFKVV